MLSFFHIMTHERGCTNPNDVPRFLRVHEGQLLAPNTTLFAVNAENVMIATPLCLLIDRNNLSPSIIHSSVECVRASAHNRLINSILSINIDRVLLDLATHDPLSWHCSGRSSQQKWMIHQKAQLDNTSHLPYAERPPSPRSTRPEQASPTKKYI